MDQPVMTTTQKALQINLDPAKYGTFAEIGAGQEVARWFFRVGGAAGTIAKSMSAYDMTFSDAIYGPAERYVCRHRLATMLEHEYRLLKERLQAKRGAQTQFFVFANTVAARSYRGNNECHGWLGVRFQSAPETEPNTVLIHVRMLDRENVAQQEALGIIGVNLIHGAFYLANHPTALVAALLDNLTTDRIEVDIIKLTGPDFEQVDNRLLSLHLVKLGLTDAAMFAPNGEALQPSEMLYKKPILVERGRFRPVTKINLEMMECARARFCEEGGVKGREIVEIMEITMHNLLSSGEVDHRDFLQRIDVLCSLGKTVLISDYAEFHALTAYLSRYTKAPIGIVLGIPLLREIFDEKYYTDLDGGLLESCGRLFKNGVKLYVYPAVSTDTGRTLTADNLDLPEPLRPLYLYLLTNAYIEPLKTLTPGRLGFTSQDVEDLIRQNNPEWKHLVVPRVAQLIKEKHLFGFQVD
jgi:hypothetical protein